MITVVRKRAGWQGEETDNIRKGGPTLTPVPGFRRMRWGRGAVTVREENGVITEEVKEKQHVRFSCQEICRERQDSITGSSGEGKGGKGPSHKERVAKSKDRE